MAGAPPSARTKRSVEKFMDDEYDCNDIIEVDSEQWPPAKDRLLLPQPESSQRLSSFSSPFNIQRSASQEHLAATGIVPSRPTTSLASSSSCLPSLSFQLEINKDKLDSQESGGGGGSGGGESDSGGGGGGGGGVEAVQYQRTNSLPPPAPVYTGSYSRLFRSPSSSSPAQKTSWSVSPLPPPFKQQTNGNFAVSAGLLRPEPGITSSSTSQSNPAVGGEELDEDYDC